MSESSQPAVPASKYCRESRVFKTGRVFPNDINNHKTLFGGKLMSNIDEVASISAMRHCRCNVVTASTDSVDFLLPIRPTDSFCFESFVSWTGRTSIEVFVKVISENLYTGERAVAATAFLTFVAIGQDGAPSSVPSVIPETEEEKLISDLAEERANLRKVRRAASKNLASKLTTTKYWE
ncbi:acyl-CoA thioesterase [Paenibacillus sp. HN-1]|uniref:acyl-CoA thioesterase n=1 Tax=Paenibacillus TaxID=44249 RepID=UPI001CAA3904|nr:MULTISPECIES: acyl-CoA thioesterase [Paenibacillus]MBY9080863.1 acyl-CoA thioesterase [Paenibacillus sp. CGMCC 1.18879]MBY9085145.1 acyl-CoA thioesterase [Paenibacillus sinensis]